MDLAILAGGGQQKANMDGDSGRKCGQEIGWLRIACADERKKGLIFVKVPQRSVVRHRLQ
jgi:hypothetical protein